MLRLTFQPINKYHVRATIRLAAASGSPQFASCIAELMLRHRRSNYLYEPITVRRDGTAYAQFMGKSNMEVERKE